MFNNPSVPASYSVASVAELKEPVEVKISNEAIPQSDFDTIVKRLNAFGADFYIDQNTGILALNKNDLGSTNQEILATLHMLTGEGKIKLDSPAGSENALSIDDIEKAVYSDNKDNNCTYVNIKLNDKGAEKIAKIDEEMQSAGQDHLMYLYVDDNLRANDGVFEVIDKEIIYEGGYDGKEFLASNPFVITAHAEQVEGAIKLSPNYIRLIVSIINDGKLTKSYEVVIDEKYGITVEQEPEPTEPPAEETEEPVEPAKPDYNKPSGTNKKPSGTTKPKEEAPAQQVAPPVQEQTPVQPPVQQPQQPAQSSGSSNENNLPEFYMDFE